LIPDDLLFRGFFERDSVYYSEEWYFFENIDMLNLKRVDSLIPTKFCGLTNYKKMFKIMGRIMLYEEEAVT
jgi:hypothetical protein